MTNEELYALLKADIDRLEQKIEAKMGIRPKELTGRKRIETIAEREARIVIGKK